GECGADPAGGGAGSSAPGGGQPAGGGGVGGGGYAGRTAGARAGAVAARDVWSRPADRELDVLLSTGELVSCTLLAMALRELGVPARSFSGAQAGIVTDRAHGRARIVQMEPRRVHHCLD